MNETILRSLSIISLTLFLVQTVKAEIVINEIMPHKNNLWNDEWVELYNTGNETVVFNGSIGDNNSNDTIANLVIPALGFALIVDSNTNLNNKTGCDSLDISNQNCIELTAIGNGLSDNGENLTLYNSSSHIIDNYTWYSNPGTNVSIGRYPDGGSWNESLIPTPSLTNQPTPPLQENLELSVYLDSPVVSSISYTRLFEIEIENKDGCSEKDNVSVSYNITDSTGNLVKESSFTREIGCSGYADTGEWTAGEVGNFTLCGLVTGSTVSETDLSDNSACKDITVVENPITLLSIPTQASFGFFKTTFIRLNTSYYDYNRTRFLLYGKSSRVVADWNWDKITSYAECQGETAVEINTTGNKTYFLSIPFFLYPDCDNYYSNGEYEIGLRVCNPKDSGFEKFLEIYFSLAINGRNEKLCERQTTVEYKTVYSSGYISPPAKEEYYEIISYPDAVYVGEEFDSIVRLRTNIVKNVTIYSYVFDGKKLLSEGFDGEAWHKTWTANKQPVTLNPKSPVTLALKNKIKEDAVPGEYKFRVRIQDEKDLTKDITILPQVAIESESSSPMTLSCNETDNKIYLSAQNDGQFNASLYIFTETGVDVKKLTIENGKETLETREGYNYIQLISDDVILDSCSITKEKPLEITGRFTGVSKLPRLLQQLYDWLKEIFNISK